MEPPCVTRSEFSRNGMLESEKIEVISGYFVCVLHFFCEGVVAGGRVVVIWAYLGCQFVKVSIFG